MGGAAASEVVGVSLQKCHSIKVQSIPGTPPFSRHHPQTLGRHHGVHSEKCENNVEALEKNSQTDQIKKVSTHTHS